MKRTIEIKACHGCVFASNDNEEGWVWCELYDLSLRELDDNEIHKDCKLDKEELSFKLVN